MQNLFLHFCSCSLRLDSQKTGYFQNDFNTQLFLPEISIFSRYKNQIKVLESAKESKLFHSNNMGNKKRVIGSRPNNLYPCFALPFSTLSKNLGHNIFRRF